MSSRTRVIILLLFLSFIFLGGAGVLFYIQQTTAPEDTGAAESCPAGQVLIPANDKTGAEAYCALLVGECGTCNAKQVDGQLGCAAGYTCQLGVQNTGPESLDPNFNPPGRCTPVGESRDFCLLPSFSPSGLCGNGVVDAGEQCDDGNVQPGDGCNGICEIDTLACPQGQQLVVGTFGSYCALVAGECGACDISETEGSITCGAVPRDGLPPINLRCSTGGDTTGVCVPPIQDTALCVPGYTPVTQCGNGVVEAPEQCDDGNTDPGDGCNGICRNEAGAGGAQQEPSTQCNDGIDNDGDGKIDCDSQNPDLACFPNGAGGGGACDPTRDSETDTITAFSCGGTQSVNADTSPFGSDAQQFNSMWNSFGQSMTATGSSLTMTIAAGENSGGITQKVETSGDFEVEARITSTSDVASPDYLGVILLGLHNDGNSRIAGEYMHEIRDYNFVRGTIDGNALDSYTIVDSLPYLRVRRVGSTLTVMASEDGINYNIASIQQNVHSGPVDLGFRLFKGADTGEVTVNLSNVTIRKCTNQCNDGIDNDGDGRIDCVSGNEDPGCYPNGSSSCVPTDNDETDELPDYIGLNIQLRTESGFEAGEVVTNPSPGDEVFIHFRYNLYAPASVGGQLARTVSIEVNGENFADSSGSPDVSFPLERWDYNPRIPFVVPQGSFSIQGLVDFASAEGNISNNTASAQFTAVGECGDGIDNDGDGLIDCQAGNEDPGCFPDGSGGGGVCDTSQNSEEDGGACGNGVIDAGEACDDGAANSNSGAVCNTQCQLNATCNDGVDNDGDGLIDCQAGNEDPGCFPDGNGGGGSCSVSDNDEANVAQSGQDSAVGQGAGSASQGNNAGTSGSSSSNSTTTGSTTGAQQASGQLPDTALGDSIAPLLIGLGLLLLGVMYNRAGGQELLGFGFVDKAVSDMSSEMEIYNDNSDLSDPFERQVAMAQQRKARKGRKNRE